MQIEREKKVKALFYYCSYVGRSNNGHSAVNEHLLVHRAGVKVCLSYSFSFIFYITFFECRFPTTCGRLLVGKMSTVCISNNRLHFSSMSERAHLTNFATCYTLSIFILLFYVRFASDFVGS